MQNVLKRAWAQINLDAVDNNITQIRSVLAPGCLLCATVKADCYGHGYKYMTQEMVNSGADWFAVSNLAEALQLRRCGIERPILILGYTPPENARELVYNDISQAVFSYDYARALSDAVAPDGVKVNAHIKMDTGMSRLGFLYHDSVEDYPVFDEIERVCRLPGIAPEGIFTHFSSADCQDGEAYTRIQYDLYLSAVERLRRRGIEFPLRHCSNSAAILRFHEMDFDMVRAGIILYGLYPSAEVPKDLRLLPVMELKTVVSLVKTLPAGTPVSYSRAYVTDRETTVATVPIGYADGYPRRLSGRMDMLVNGRRAPIVGNICMDQCMLDVTGIDGVREGTEVTVFGADHGAFIGVDEIAEQAGVINYEVVCGLSRRVPRIYLRNNEIIEVTDYML